MNCSFEDCSELNRFIGTYSGDWKKIFKEFEKSRKPNSDAIADLAVENFYEMRDLVADPRFLLKKKVEHILEEKFSDFFVPKYAMVTFHRIPYSVAMERGKIQDIILDEITTGIHDPHHVDIAIAEHLIKTRLTPWSDVVRL
ncbi:MAG TPA: kynurenine 3-monooxygenase, partial [bacterium]|nr:kynurenine 3-monooxygenase [bacterium]